MRAVELKGEKKTGNGLNSDHHVESRRPRVDASLRPCRLQIQATEHSRGHDNWNEYNILLRTPHNFTRHTLIYVSTSGRGKGRAPGSSSLSYEVVQLCAEAKTILCSIPNGLQRLLARIKQVRPRPRYKLGNEGSRVPVSPVVSSAPSSKSIVSENSLPPSTQRSQISPSFKA